MTERNGPATGGSPDDAFGLDRIGQVAVTARDLDRAVAFYRDTLGMAFLFRADSMAFFRCGDVRIMLGEPEGGETDHPASILYYAVEDIDAAHRALESRGVGFEGEPHLVAELGGTELWMAFFRDSEENLLALMSEVAAGPPTGGDAGGAAGAAPGGAGRGG